jgi:hypothetical protein
MAKKKKNNAAVPEEHGKSTADYYKLNSDAVDRLVNANAENAPEVSQKEIEKVAGKKRLRIPFPVKAVFIKFWFAGATCFFFYFGLGAVLQQTDLLFALAVALGAIKNLLENNILRFMERTEGESRQFMLVEYKQFWGLFLDVMYGFLLLGVTMYVYNLIALAIAAAAGNEAVAGFGVEPLLFGVIVTAADMLFISIKNLIKKIINDAKSSASQGTVRKK